MTGMFSFTDFVQEDSKIIQTEKNSGLTSNGIQTFDLCVWSTAMVTQKSGCESKTSLNLFRLLLAAAKVVFITVMIFFTYNMLLTSLQVW